MRAPQGALPSFAGVALADILANSVAIVIIMIVVTLMARHEQEREKLEQTEDVAVLLSREMATSFVMNALPTSPPAQLHDYEASPLDRNPHHATMPIIELRRDTVRDYYTGRSYPRDELLRQDNAFDAYLSGLRPEQLAALRMDIYSTRLFYIALSILKAHGHTPRHWHFLGGGAGGGRHLAGSRVATQPNESPNESAASAGPGEADGPKGARPRRAGAPGAWPQDVALAPAAGVGRYPRDGVDDTGGLPTAAAALDLPGHDGDAELAGPPGVGNQAATPLDDAKRFRTAMPVSPTATPPLPLTFNMTQVLRGLWAFMAAEQRAADAGLPSRLPRYDFERHVLGAAAAESDAGDKADPHAEAREQALRGVVFLLQTPRAPGDKRLTLRAAADNAVRGQALAVFPNEPIGRALWLRDGNQPAQASPLDATVSLRLGLHAEVHQGVRVALGRDSLLLTPYAEAEPDPAPRWRVVTLANAQRNDFVTGFVYAAVDDAGRLLLPVDENAVEIGGLRAESRFPEVAWRGETRRLWLYGLVALVFAAGLIARYWRLA